MKQACVIFIRNIVSLTQLWSYGRYGEYMMNHNIKISDRWSEHWLFCYIGNYQELGYIEEQLNTHFLKLDVLEAGEAGKWKNLCNFDKAQIVMSRWLDQSVWKMVCWGVPGQLPSKVVQRRTTNANWRHVHGHLGDYMLHSFMYNNLWHYLNAGAFCSVTSVFRTLPPHRQ